MAEKNRAKVTQASTNAVNSTWTDEETETLLDIFAEETVQHSLDTAKSPKDKNAVYRDVKVQLEVKGIFKEVSAIINKLKKMRVKYKTEKGKLKKSGTSRPIKGWKFFEKMDAIYKENPPIQPPYVVDSSKKSGESDLSDEETTSFEGSDVFTMDETKKSVTESEGGSMSGSTVESKASLSESEGGSTCGSTVDNNRKRGKQITGSKTVKSKKKTKLEKSLDAICANFMEVSQADVKRLEEVEEKRHERELKYRLELQRIESERRREEREHEMKLMQMLMHARGFSSNTPVAMHQYDSTASYSQMMGCDASTGARACEPLYSHDDSNTYYSFS